MTGFEILDPDRLWALAADPESPEHIRDQAWEEVYYRQRHGERPEYQLALMAQREADRIERLRKAAVYAELTRKAKVGRESRRAVWEAANARFPTRRDRRLFIYGETQRGRTQTAIAAELGVSTSEISRICRKVEREMRRPVRRLHTPDGMAGRPLDPGGPRDVWLEFYPPPDPRFDNMAPVMLDNAGALAS